LKAISSLSLRALDGSDRIIENLFISLNADPVSVHISSRIGGGHRTCERIQDRVTLVRVGEDWDLEHLKRFLSGMDLSREDLGDVCPHIGPSIELALRWVLRIVTGVTSLRVEIGNVEGGRLLDVALHHVEDLLTSGEVVVLDTVGTLLVPRDEVGDSHGGLVLHPVGILEEGPESWDPVTAPHVHGATVREDVREGVGPTHHPVHELLLAIVPLVPLLLDDVTIRRICDDCLQFRVSEMFLDLIDHFRRSAVTTDRQAVFEFL